MNTLLKARYVNELKAEFISKSENESFARMIVASFVAPLDPTIEELSDIRTAVSEAVTNSIVHGYSEKKGNIYLECYAVDDVQLCRGVQKIQNLPQPGAVRPGIVGDRLDFAFRRYLAFKAALRDAVSQEGNGNRGLSKNVALLGTQLFRNIHGFTPASFPASGQNRPAYEP